MNDDVALDAEGQRRLETIKRELSSTSDEVAMMTDLLAAFWSLDCRDELRRSF